MFAKFTTELAHGCCNLFFFETVHVYMRLTFQNPMITKYLDDLCVLWGLIFGGPLTSSFLLLAVNKIYSRQRFNYAVMGCYTCDHAELLGDETKDAISLNGLDGNAPTGIIGMFRHITRIGSSEIPSIKPGNFPRCISVVYQSVTQLED